MAKRGENIYKRKDGRWEARAIKGYRRDKAEYIYFYGQTYKDAKEKLLMALSFDRDNRGVDFNSAAGEMDFGGLLDLWLDNSKARLKKSSYAKYFNLINNHIKPALGGYPLSDITSSILNNFAAGKLKNGRLNSAGRLSKNTVTGIMSTIKAALRFAKDEALLSEANIKLSLPREKLRDTRVMSKSEQAALEKYLRSDMDELKLGVLLCLYTGLRVGEICALKWADIAAGENILTVSRAMQRVQILDPDSDSKTKVIITEPKSGRSARKIPLPDFLIDKLRLFRPNNQNAYFLTGEAGRYIEPRAYQNRFKSYVRDCGIEGVTFHATRHTFATRCVEVGFEVKSLSEILGHSSIKITLDRYVHSSFDLKKDNMSKLNNLY